MANVQLGASSDVSDALYWTKKADRMVSQYRASALGTGRYAMLQGMERELNSYITRVGRPMLYRTQEGSALLHSYDALALLEASERSISSLKIIVKAKAAAAKAQAEASQRIIDNAKTAEAKAKAEASQRIITKVKIAEAEAKAKASQQAAKERYEASLEKEGSFTPRIDAGRDVLDPPTAGFMKGGLSMPIMLGLGGAALAAAYFVFKG